MPVPESHQRLDLRQHRVAEPANNSLPLRLMVGLLTLNQCILVRIQVGHPIHRVHSRVVDPVIRLAVNQRRWGFESLL